MTTEVNQQQAANPPADQKPPVVDTAAIVAEATKAATEHATKIIDQKATEIASQKLKAIGQSLTGEADPSPEKAILEGFVKDPIKTLNTVKEITKKELREEMEQRQQIADVQRSVVTPFISEYPELNSPKKLAAVEKFAESYERQGMSYSEALKKGCEDAVNEFGLKSVSEAQREGSYRAVGLPHGGGVSPSAPQRFDEAKSNSDFLSGMKSRMNSFRTKKS